MQRRTLLLDGSRWTALAAWGGTWATASLAQDAPTPMPPAHVAEAVPGARFTGQARMRFLGFDIYDAALWVQPGFQAAQYSNSGLILELAYLRGLNGRAIAQRSLSEMRRGGTISPTQEQRWLAAMTETFPDVKAGDRITGLHHPLNGARFWVNGVARAPIHDPEFSRLFFGIWLSTATSEPQLRSALLAKALP